MWFLIFITFQFLSQKFPFLSKIEIRKSKSFFLLLAHKLMVVREAELEIVL